MATTVGAPSLNPRMPAAFFQLNIAGQPVGAGLTNDLTETPAGTYVPVIGDLLPVWEPGMRSGRGTFSRFELYGNSLPEIIQGLLNKSPSQTGITNSISGSGNLISENTGWGIDFRFLSLDATGTYNDGNNTTTITLHGVQITEWGIRIERGDQNLRENVSFVFQYMTISSP